MKAWKMAAACAAMVLGVGQAQAVRYVEFTVSAHGVATLLRQDPVTLFYSDASYYATSTAVFAFDVDQQGAMVSYNGTPIFVGRNGGTYTLSGSTSERLPSTIEVTTARDALFVSTIPIGSISMPGQQAFRGSVYSVVQRDVQSGSALSVSTLIGNPVPEPATWGLMLVGFGALGATVRRQRVRFAAA